VKVRTRALALAAAACAAAALTAAGAAAHSSAHARSASASHRWTVKIVKTSKGSLLVGANGHTLYMFSRDHRGHDACVSMSGCAAAWPPLYVKGKPVAGTGARASLLSTIAVKGHKQVAYAGHPLYYYAYDAGPAQTGYLGFKAFKGTWYGVSASGSWIPHGSSGSSGSGGYGGGYGGGGGGYG